MQMGYALPMTERITITLPDGLVEELDRLAAEAGTSRSGIIREASSAYVAQRRSEQRDAALRAATDETLALFAEMRRTPPLDDRPTLEILREMRGPLGRDAKAEK
jgi:predicted transcriptional regulator